MKRQSIAAFAALALLGATQLHLAAAQLTLSASLTGDQEVPATTSSAVGDAELRVDPTTGNYTLAVSAVGLSGSITSAHLHGAALGVNGPAIVPLDVTQFSGNAALTTGHFSGSLTPAILGAVLTGNTYVNLHTAAHPGGEIRGQILLDTSAEGAVVNFSCRGHINPGNGKAGILIGGFVVESPGRRVLMRAIGDGLTRWKLNSLKDTHLTVYNAAGEVVGRNDNWKDSGHAFALIATGFAPDRDSDAAFLLNLPGGAYTVHADSSQGAGIALVEMYVAPRARVGATIDHAAHGQSTQEFTVLAGLLETTGLDATLNGPGPFTLFAPTDAAFARLPAGTLDTLLPEADHVTLKEILRHHVVTANLTEGVLRDGGLPKTIDTLAAEEITVSAATGNGLEVDDAEILETDIVATNGVIHVIDTVLMP